jgi:hypothetical protein
LARNRRMLAKIEEEVREREDLLRNNKRESI